MLESVLMVASLAVLGYGFYMSSSFFLSTRKQSGPIKYLYLLASGFIITAFFISSILTFFFIGQSASGSAVNLVISIFLLSGSGLVAAFNMYHMEIVRNSSKIAVRAATNISKLSENVKQGSKAARKRPPKAKKGKRAKKAKK